MRKLFRAAIALIFPVVILCLLLLAYVDRYFDRALNLGLSGGTSSEGIGLTPMFAVIFLV